MPLRRILHARAAPRGARGHCDGVCETRHVHRPLAASALQTADAGTPRYVFPGVLRAKGYTLRAALGAREAPVLRYWRLYL